MLRYGIDTRFYLLWAALKRTDWPLWLHAAGSDVQQRFSELEESKDQYEAAYSSAFDTCFSFKDYVVRTFAAWAQRAFDERLDPEAISVHSSYTLQVAGRTIEQEETQLTEFLVFGLHDNGYKATLTIIGAPDGSRLTAVALEQWLENRNLRLEFTGSLAYSPSVAWQGGLSQLSLQPDGVCSFVARQSGSWIPPMRTSSREPWPTTLR